MIKPHVDGLTEIRLPGPCFEKLPSFHIWAWQVALRSKCGGPGAEACFMQQFTDHNMVSLLTHNGAEDELSLLILRGD